jgi:lipoprotein-anchoring transpeptidase ErfK/SrfK
MQRAYRAPAPTRPPAVTTRSSPRTLTWVVLGGILAVVMGGIIILAVGMGVLVLYASQRILPGVSAAGISLGSMTADEATAHLEANWSQITIRDGSRTWTVPPSQLGLTLDANATALAAQAHGRTEGSMLAALIGNEAVLPVLTVDSVVANQGIKSLASVIDMPPANATVRMVDGELTPVDAVEGRSMDVAATVNRLLSSPAEELADGALDLVVNPVQPTVTDASAVINQVRSLLASPLIVNAFDAITNQTLSWQVAPEQWGQWLTTANNPTRGISLALDRNALTNYLDNQNSGLTDARYVDVEKSVVAIQSSLAAGRTVTTVHILHKPTRYTIQPGDTLGTLSWKFGFPMFRIVNANRGLNMDSLSVGQTITIPSKDELLPLPVVDNKRIVVSISKQHMWVYENGQQKWSWAASTGIADSPTLPGVFQVQSHEKNAYAGNWNLWMPNFMGIYDAVPGFTNGIHGFPTRNGYGILWENSLGHPVTYGCILISSQNADALYAWAEDGVVIEIQR